MTEFESKSLEDEISNLFQCVSTLISVQPEASCSFDARGRMNVEISKRAKNG